MRIDCPKHGFVEPYVDEANDAWCLQCGAEAYWWGDADAHVPKPGHYRLYKEDRISHAVVYVENEKPPLRGGGPSLYVVFCDEDGTIDAEEERFPLEAISAERWEKVT